MLALPALLSVVSYARVRLGTHWPSDIAGGSLRGAYWLGVTIVALRAGERAAAP